MAESSSIGRAITYLTTDSGARRRLPGWVDAIVSWGENPAESRDQRQIKRAMVGALWVGLVPNVFSATSFLLEGAPWVAATLAIMELGLIGVLVGIKLRLDWWPGIIHVVIAMVIAASIALTLMYGGVAESGAAFVWGYAGILAGVVAFRDRRVGVWLVLFVIALILTEVIADPDTALYENPLPAARTIINLIAVGTFTFLVLLYFIRQRDSLRRQTDALLRNVLPDEIADRLMVSGGRIADHFDDTSILFADLVGFTPMSAGMSPAETVDLLNEVFSAFDDMVEKRGLEKIKTVGDEYMVAAGVPKPRPDHAHQLAALALEMRSHAEGTTINGRAISFRIGINSGPVVAGIIGRRKFAYDLWGDAVNMASRMESHGEAGRIQITEATYTLISDRFLCEPRGAIEIKGKGAVPVWYLEGTL